MKKNQIIIFAAILALAITACSYQNPDVNSDNNEECENITAAGADASQTSNGYMLEEEYDKELVSSHAPDSITDEKAEDTGSYDAMDRIRSLGRYNMERIEYQAD